VKDLTHTEAVSETKDEGFENRFGFVLSQVSEPIDEGSDEDITHRELEGQLELDTNEAYVDIKSPSSPGTVQSKQPPDALSEQEAEVVESPSPPTPPTPPTPPVEYEDVEDFNLELE